MKTSFSRLTFAAALSLAAALPAAAQQQGPDGPRQEQGARRDPRQRLEQRVAQLTQRLQLSADQATQVRRILEQEQQQMQQFRASRGEDRGQQGGDDAARRQGFEQMRAVRQQTEQQLERVLSPTQLAEYRKLREERGQRGGQRGERPRGDQGQGRADSR